ncbi:MAG TPA: DegQ family serine endoprotease [Candidatus Binataceae bacterium]|nr:DegQ family serine endoprotease [Candidatus Binataceae bacterium]
MVRTIVAVSGGVVLGLVIAFANAGAFPFWNDSSSAPGASKPSGAPMAEADRVQGNQMQPQPAPANAPEPNEQAVALPSWAPLVKRVMPTVVNVAVVQEVNPRNGDEEDQGDNGGGGPDDQGPPDSGPGMGPQANPFGQGNPFGGGGGQGDPFEQFKRFFGPMEQPHNYKQHGLGSGVIVSPDGYILTNFHVVGHADEIHVTLMDKREFTAKVVGKDQKTDLALIKINTNQPLPSAILGDSAHSEVGDWVLAIGSPFGFNLTVTSGIISAEGRALGGNYDNFIQTDASINPGNSGGPLFNTHGEVIGINTAIYSSTGSNAGIGFAIPIDLAKDVMEQLKTHGRVVRGWIGVEIQEVTPDLAKSFGLAAPNGALVGGVEAGGPAAKAGIQRGDIIIKYNGNPVHDEHELPEMVAQTPLNETVPIEVVRNGKHMTLQAKIAELKDTQVASAKDSEDSGSSWGLQVKDLTPDIAQQLNLSNPSQKGVVIAGVRPDSAAADAGLQPGDVILELDHKKVATADEFATLAHQLQKDNRSALILVERGGMTTYTVINPEG